MFGWLEFTATQNGDSRTHDTLAALSRREEASLGEKNIGMLACLRDFIDLQTDIIV